MDGNRICRKSRHANATTAICILVAFFYHYKLLLPLHLQFAFDALEGGEASTPTENQKEHP